MAEEVVLDDEVAVGVEDVFVEVFWGGVVVIGGFGSDVFLDGFFFGREVFFLEVDFFAGVVLGGFLHRGEEDGVVVHFWAEGAGFGVIVPFLDEEDGGFGAGVGFEDIAVEADDGEDAAVLGDVFAEVLVGGVIEAALGEDDGHATAGLEEIEVALDEEEVAAEFGLGFAVGFLAEVVFGENAGFLDVSGEGGIGHEDIEGEVVVGVAVAAEFFQSLPADVVGVDPVFVLGFLVPAFPIEGIEVEDIGLAIAGDEVESAGDADGAFIEVDGEDLFVDVVGAAGGFFLGREEVGLGEAFVGEDVFPDVEDAVDGEAAGACGGVDEGFVLLGIEHLDTHVDDVAGGEILPFFAFGGFVDEVFEGFVDDVEVGVKELDVLEGGDADGEVGGGELDFGFGFEDAFPFGVGAVEEVGDFFLQLGFSVAVVAEFEVAFFVAAGSHLIEELGEDELEEFLEDIDAGVGEDFVFHFEDEVLE